MYAKILASEIIYNGLSIEAMTHLPSDEVRTLLKKLKGIGDWTADVFLMMSLHRTDLFPIGDVALIKSIKEVKKLSGDTSKDYILIIANEWRPYRTIAAYLLWHAYLEKRRIAAVKATLD